MPSYKVSGFNYLTDNRTKFKKRLPVYIALMWLLMGFAFLVISLCKAPKLLNPGIVALPKAVEAMEPTSADCDNPLCFIRRYGQEQGYDDFTISKFIRILRCESGQSLNPEAIHKNTNGTYDIGVAQINDIHNISRKDRMDFKLNIAFAYKLLGSTDKPRWNTWVCAGKTL